MLEIFQKSPLKFCLIKMGAITIITVLVIYFQVLPILFKTMAEIAPTEVETIKNKIEMVTVGSSGFIFLFIFYFWRLDDELEKKKRELETILKMNPQDSVALGQLEQIEKKRKNYIAIIEPILTIILGGVIGFIAVTITNPLYNFIGKL